MFVVRVGRPDRRFEEGSRSQFCFFFSSRRRHTRFKCDWSSDVCSSDLDASNAFAKYTWDASSRTHLYSDLQLRSTNFHYHGDVAIAPIRWTFFNPKLGVRHDLTATSGVYASAGLSRREPTRNDLFQGEDNATFA